MKGHNYIAIIGNITNDTNVDEYTRDGQANNRLRFSVAVNGYKEGDVDFFNVTGWGKLADALSFLRKGMRVFVEGRMKLDRVKSTVNGVEETKVYPSIVATNIMCLDKKEESVQEANTTPEPSVVEVAPI
tara:strand:- start:220 stop:609 length:390 start_codon:yes stop_codon:yes gene_type:complete